MSSPRPVPRRSRHSGPASRTGSRPHSVPVPRDLLPRPRRLRRRHSRLLADSHSCDGSGTGTLRDRGGGMSRGTNPYFPIASVGPEQLATIGFFRGTSRAMEAFRFAPDPGENSSRVSSSPSAANRLAVMISGPVGSRKAGPCRGSIRPQRSPSSLSGLRLTGFADARRPRNSKSTSPPRHHFRGYHSPCRRCPWPSSCPRWTGPWRRRVRDRYPVHSSRAGTPPRDRCPRGQVPRCNRSRRRGSAGRSMQECLLTARSFRQS